MIFPLIRAVPPPIAGPVGLLIEPPFVSVYELASIVERDGAGLADGRVGAALGGGGGADGADTGGGGGGGGAAGDVRPCDAPNAFRAACSARDGPAPFVFGGG
jgi:hypothetical protein